jgi:hypothetical protein
MKLARMTTALALATTLAAPLAASASEWAFDDPYWQAQASRRAEANVQVADTTGPRDIFGRPIVSGITPIDQLDAFDPTRTSYAYANGGQASPVQYAQRSTGTVSDATETNGSQSARRPTDDGAQVIQDTEAERQQLDRAGFPQYNQ